MPKPKDIVKAVMKYRGREDLPVNPNTRHIYQCMKPGCGREIKFLAKSGLSNPYFHLRSCYASDLPRSEQEAVVKKLFQNALYEETKLSGSILSDFNVAALSETDKAVFNYLRLIIMCSMPISIIKNPVFRRVSWFDVRIKHKTLVEVILSLVGLVEGRISAEMESRVGEIMYDSWSHCSTHYVVFYGLCTTESPEHGRRTLQNRIITRFILLGVLPMGQICDNDEQQGVKLPNSTPKRS